MRNKKAVKNQRKRMHTIFSSFFRQNLATEGNYKQPKQLTQDGDTDEDDSMLCKTVVTRDRRYITQITCYEKGSEKQAETEIKKQAADRPPTYGKQTNGGALASLFSFPSRSSSLTRTQNQLKQQQFFKPCIFSMVLPYIFDRQPSSILKDWSAFFNIPLCCTLKPPT